MKPRAYIETTILSYLTARPSRDLIQAAHQQITQDWWESRRGDFDLYISELVIAEISCGDPEAAKKRREIASSLPVLRSAPVAIDLADELLRLGVLPAVAADDALHLAIASVYEMRFLLTWNCRHLANAEMTESIEQAVSAWGYNPPVICTPQELMGRNE